MGTKIKPSFKSEFPLASEGWHLFRIVEPKIDTIAPEDRGKTKDGIENDKNFVVRSAVEGGEEDGIEIQEFFANYSKKEFGLSRLVGLMIKTEAIPPTDETDVDTMRTEKFETKFKMSLPKRLFGGRVKHAKMKSREDQTQELTFANIVEYATVKEYNEIITKQGDREVPGRSKGSGKERDEKSAGTSKEGVKEPIKDPWA